MAAAEMAAAVGAILISRPACVEMVAAAVAEAAVMAVALMVVV